MLIEFDIVAVLKFFGIPSSVTSLCFWALKEYLDKKDTRQEQEEKARTQNEFLLIKSIRASLALGEATAHAV